MASTLLRQSVTASVVGQRCLVTCGYTPSFSCGRAPQQSADVATTDDMAGNLVSSALAADGVTDADSAVTRTAVAPPGVTLPAPTAPDAVTDDPLVTWACDGRSDGRPVDAWPRDGRSDWQFPELVLKRTSAGERGSDSMGRPGWASHRERVDSVRHVGGVGLRRFH